MSNIENKSPQKIEGFKEAYAFLSNFYPSSIEYLGIVYPTVEHAYQAQKADSAFIKLKIASLAQPGQAKRYGAKIDPLPINWHWKRTGIMSDLIDLKFKDPQLAQMLIETGDAELEETNFWGDIYWGVCNGTGENILGKLLMNKRNTLTGGKSSYHAIGTPFLSSLF